LQIELEKLRKSYGRELPAIRDVDLAVSRGERLAVLGPSGSGKTTLLRLIAGLESPDSGVVRIGGNDMGGVPPHRRGVAMMFQNPALYPFLRVRDNLAFGLAARRVSRPTRRRRAVELASLLGIEPLLDRWPATLSGGERQRVALGRALAPRPAVLLLDEPFANLDEPLRVELRAELLCLHGQLGFTLVHVTHDQKEALALGHRLAVVREGRLVQVDTAMAVHDRPADRFVAAFVGTPMNFLDEAAFEEAGEPIPPQLESLRPPRRLVLGFRPERVALSDPGENGTLASPELILPVQVVSVEFQGESSLASTRLGSRPLLARIPPHKSLPSDRRAVAHIDLSGACWFDSRSGLRVEPDCQHSGDAIA